MITRFYACRYYKPNPRNAPCLYCQDERKRREAEIARDGHAILLRAFGPEVTAIVEATDYNPPPLVVLDAAGKVIEKIEKRRQA